MGFLKNKKFLIVGIISPRSIAYGIAMAMYEQGAQLSFTYQSKRLEKKVKNITNKFCPDHVLECDVSIDDHIENVFLQINKTWENLDGIIHSVAYSPKEELRGDFVSEVTREGFKITHDISVYSLLALVKYGRYMMKNAAITTLSYLGSPIAPKRMASQDSHRSRVSSGSGSPVSSMAMAPTWAYLNKKV